MCFRCVVYRYYHTYLHSWYFSVKRALLDDDGDETTVGSSLERKVRRRRFITPAVLSSYIYNNIDWCVCMLFLHVAYYHYTWYIIISILHGQLGSRLFCWACSFLSDIFFKSFRVRTFHRSDNLRSLLCTYHTDPFRGFASSICTCLQGGDLQDLNDLCMFPNCHSNLRTVIHAYHACARVCKRPVLMISYDLCALYTFPRDSF